MGTSSNVATPGVPQGSSSIPVPLGTILKAAAADPKTTNVLLAVVVLCMSGLMPDQLSTLCGV